MSDFISSSFKIGITAGGQLGKMLGLAAANWDIQTFFMDPDENCPAHRLANHFVKGDFRKAEDLYHFGRSVDLLTFEIEHISIEALNALSAEGIEIIPPPKTMEIIQDKGLQKELFKKHNIPTLPFRLFESPQEITDAVRQKTLSLPFVQKTRKMGYDGKGVAVIRTEEEMKKLLPGPSVAEELCEIDKELSVIIAGNRKGEIAIYAPIEMQFNPEAHLVEMLLFPAPLTENIEKQCKDIAYETFKALDMTGILAVEMFLDRKGNLWVNEVAPRPHNSGHHTIEACYTSQFEQHLRAILNLPLGSTEVLHPSVMINLLGHPDYSGPVKYQGFQDIIALPGVFPHIYGKKETRPFRKMGHITILDNSLEKALEKANYVKQHIRVISV